MDNSLISTDLDRKCLEEALKLRIEHKHSFGTIIKGKRYRYLFDWLVSKTPLLDGIRHTAVTRLYWVANGIVDFPVCKFCGKARLKGNVDSFERGYFRACSVKCEGMKEARLRKIEDTCLKNWGAANFFGSDAGREVRESWCREHGVDNPFQLESVKEKSRESRKANFGCEYTMQSEEKRRLASDGYRRRTGYGHQFENPDVIARSMRMKAEKKAAGIDDYAKARTTNRKARYKAFLENPEVRPVFSEDDFTGLDAHTQYTTLLRWKCLKCGIEFDAYIDQNFSSRNGVPARCEKCHPFIHDGVSDEEREFVGFIRGACAEAVTENDRSVIKPYELDVFVRGKSLAFEFDGLYWHSDSAGKGAGYHLMKTEMCGKAGVRLIHVFEDEWREKRPIVESRIKNVLGLYGKIVYARKCAVTEVDSKTSNAFLEENHLQGSVNGSVRLGLFDGNELVALMTFGKCRFDKRHEWEMLRFCTKLGYHVPGAAGKLLRQFERTCRPRSLVTYADRRWSEGGLYKKLGLDFVRNSPPGYFYVKADRRYSRLVFQKHKLGSVLKAFDPKKTETENMKENGYSRIFDCGNLVFEKEYPENVK